MNAIAVEIPDDVTVICDSLRSFAKSEIFTRHEENKEFFEDQRQLYREDGRFSDKLIRLISEVRTASAKAGFYGMCVPEELGGGGLGHLAYYVAWEELFRFCGPKNWLMLYAFSHWAFGPSKLLEITTVRA